MTETEFLRAIVCLSALAGAYWRTPCAMRRRHLARRYERVWLRHVRQSSSIPLDELIRGDVEALSVGYPSSRPIDIMPELDAPRKR